MTYRIRPDRDLLTEVRRIAAEQATKAQQDLTSIGDGDVVEAVHDARKRCKKVRGLARLVRPALGGSYKDTNRAFRDAARTLSRYRDAQGLLDTFDRLVVADNHRLPDAGLAPVRQALAARCEHSVDDIEQSDDSIGEALELIREGIGVVESWTLDDDGWDAIGPGLRTTYSRGAEALAVAANDGTTVDFHELRKRAKYTWYHVRLLRSTAPSILRPLADRLHDLSDALGDAHDLAVLTDQVRSEPDEFGGEAVIDSAVTFFDGRRRDLERRSLVTAHRLYTESPKRFARRLGGYWECHDQWGDEVAVGEIGGDTKTSITDPFDDMSVSELQVVARDVDLAGRSLMLRDDLVASLRAAGVGRTEE